MLALLRRYEPVIRYTAGELFLPTGITGYLGRAALWQRSPRRCLARTGELTPELLAEYGERFRTSELYLRFVKRPLNRADHRRWRAARGPATFRPSSRFAAVGLAARLVDAVLRLSLLLRGTVPGGTRAAAQQQYAAHLGPDVHPYYGHVSRDGGYVVLQYWYFYAMNDWRSTFGGVNDHEADWEHVTIYLAEPVEPGGDPQPAWVAYSAHDLHGDDIRRRWDDPDLELVGEHPVVYAGAGSHAGGFRRGEYVTTVALPGQHRLVRAIRAVNRLVAPGSTSTGGPAVNFGIPFLDYHRGDGTGIGPGEPRDWSPELIDDDVGWIRGYRGLWGLDTRDRFSGERAPAGPRYERDGAIRASWLAPVTWAQLDAQPPTRAHAPILRERRAAAVERRLAGLDTEIARRREEQREQRAGAGRDLSGGAPDIAALQRERRELVQECDALALLRSRPDADGPDPVPPGRAVPVTAPAARQRFLAMWSALSVSVLLAGIALILLNPPVGVFWSLAGLLVVLLGIEAAAQSRLARFVRGLVVTAVVLVAARTVTEVAVRNWRLGAAALLTLGALALLAGNIRAWLTRRPGR